MAERRASLLDDSGPSQSSGKSKGGGLSGDKGKLILAIGLFVVAGVVYLWLGGHIGGPAKSPPPSAEDQAAYQEQVKAAEAAQKGPRPPVVGGD